MKRLLLNILLCATLFVGCTDVMLDHDSLEEFIQENNIPSSQIIYYTTHDGSIVPIDDYIGYAKVIANYYENGRGAIVCDRTITSIGYAAFLRCYNLASITIPNSVTSIENRAFYECHCLTSVTIGNSVTSIGNQAFYWCDGLTSLTIPNSVALIGNYAFYECRGLTSVYCKATTPPTLGGGGVFDYVGSGRKIYVPTSSVSAYKSATYWSEYASSIVGDGSESGATVPSNYEIWYTSSDGTIVKPHSTSAFDATIISNTYKDGCGVITFDKEISSIGDYAFWYCDGLTSITIPNSVTSIGDWAFRSCDGLTSITIPNSVTSIGNSAFFDCDGLTSVTIGNGVTSIGANPFLQCSKLKEFKGKFASSDGRCLIVDGVLNSFAPSGLTTYTIPNSVTSIGDYAFWYCDGLTSITIPNSVTSIGNSAFVFCFGLTSITIPNSVTSIGNSAFLDCNGLTSITIPNSVTSIGDSAFRDCDGLTSITIPNSVTSIGADAFRVCYRLTSVYCKATTPPTLGVGYVFGDNASSRIIYVPTASVSAYKSAPYWSSYELVIVGYDF